MKATQLDEIAIRLRLDEIEPGLVLVCSDAQNVQ